MQLPGLDKDGGKVMQEQEIFARLMQTGALLEGHFLLRSGLHSNRYFQAALALQYTDIATELCSALAQKYRGRQIDTVISPAVGGIVVGQETGRALGVRAIFAEKDEKDELILRRGFKLSPGERVLVAEDVITRGGRVQQTVELARQHKAQVEGVAVLVDRSKGQIPLDVEVKSLLQLQLDTYQPDECPLCRQGMPLVKPGS